VPSTRRASIGDPLRLPWQVYERGTVYRQLSAQPPHRLLPLKKNLNHFCLDCHSVCDNVCCLLTMFSALAAVCTIYCAIEIVLITLHLLCNRLPGYSCSTMPRQPGHSHHSMHRLHKAGHVHSARAGLENIMIFSNISKIL